jgi:hypothetical protein
MSFGFGFGFPRQIGARSQNWTPAQITTALWLDAADASTIVLNGSTVSQWNDKSGNGRHVVQATAANQPPYDAAGINGKGALNITTAPRWLLYSDTSTGAEATIATIGSPVDLTSNSRMAGLVTTTTSTDARKSFAPASDGSFRYDGANNPGVPLPAGTQIRVSTRTATDAIDWRNGSFGFQATPPTDPIMRNFVAGNAIVLDSLALGTFTGLIGEVVVTYTAISTTDRQKLEGYLAWKWGLQANLPVGHPYKDAPPTV